jgi:hypothetical protein
VVFPFLLVSLFVESSIILPLVAFEILLVLFREEKSFDEIKRRKEQE